MDDSFKWSIGKHKNVCCQHNHDKVFCWSNPLNIKYWREADVSIATPIKVPLVFKTKSEAAQNNFPFGGKYR
jgi:hypothetical protein